MNKKTNAVTPPSIFGLSLLFVTFLILCLFTFAAISLSGARSDYKASQQLADKTTTYNEAANAAEEYIADLDATLASNPDTAEETVSFSVPVSDSRRLNVTVELTDATNLKTNSSENDESVTNGSKQYKITEWVIEDTSEWTGSTQMNLMILE